MIGMLQALGKLIGRYRFTRAYYAEAVASAAATNHAYSDAGDYDALMMRRARHLLATAPQ